MASITAQALAALIAAHNCVPPKLAPVMIGIAQHESGLNPTLIHRNSNGTVDVGIAQINSSNFGWLGLTMQKALDPCANIAAGARVLLVKYNGNPPDTIKVAYANDVLARISAEEVKPSDPTVTENTGPPPACSAPTWDTWGQEECQQNQGTNMDDRKDTNDDGDDK